jgi:predicted HTH domain antitoxin
MSDSQYSNQPMTIGIDLPEENARQLQDRWGNLESRAREAVVIEAYRAGALSEAQVQQLLRLGSRFEMDAVLKKAGVPLDYSETDLARDIETSRRVGFL